MQLIDFELSQLAVFEPHIFATFFVDFGHILFEPLLNLRFQAIRDWYLLTSLEHPDLPSLVMVVLGWRQ